MIDHNHGELFCVDGTGSINITFIHHQFGLVASDDVTTFAKIVETDEEFVQIDIA